MSSAAAKARPCVRRPAACRWPRRAAGAPAWRARWRLRHRRRDRRWRRLPAAGDGRQVRRARPWDRPAGAADRPRPPHRPAGRRRLAPPAAIRLRGIRPRATARWAVSARKTLPPEASPAGAGKQREQPGEVLAVAGLRRQHQGRRGPVAHQDRRAPAQLGHGAVDGGQGPARRLVDAGIPGGRCSGWACSLGRGRAFGVLESS